MLVREVGSFSFHAIVRVAENGKDGRTRFSITVMNGDYHAISGSAVNLLFEIWDVVLTLCVKGDEANPRVHFAVRMFTHIVQCNQCRLNPPPYSAPLRRGCVSLPFVVPGDLFSADVGQPGDGFVGHESLGVQIAAGNRLYPSSVGPIPDFAVCYEEEQHWRYE
jgi:hypothetical protein